MDQLTAMPSMEIIADQVSCAHGATVADLSPEELFYLQSRGFTKEAARAIQHIGGMRVAASDPIRPRLLRRTADL